MQNNQEKQSLYKYEEMYEKTRGNKDNPIFGYGIGYKNLDNHIASFVKWYNHKLLNPKDYLMSDLILDFYYQEFNKIGAYQEIYNTFFGKKTVLEEKEVIEDNKFKQIKNEYNVEYLKEVSLEDYLILQQSVTQKIINNNNYIATFFSKETLDKDECVKQFRVFNSNSNGIMNTAKLVLELKKHNIYKIDPTKLPSYIAILKCENTIKLFEERDLDNIRSYFRDFGIDGKANLGSPTDDEVDVFRVYDYCLKQMEETLKNHPDYDIRMNPIKEVVFVDEPNRVEEGKLLKKKEEVAEKEVNKEEVAEKKLNKEEVAEKDLNEEEANEEEYEEVPYYDVNEEENSEDDQDIDDEEVEKGKPKFVSNFDEKKSDDLKYENNFDKDRNVEYVYVKSEKAIFSEEIIKLYNGSKNDAYKNFLAVVQSKDSNGSAIKQYLNDDNGKPRIFLKREFDFKDSNNVIYFVGLAKLVSLQKANKVNVFSKSGPNSLEQIERELMFSFEKKAGMESNLIKEIFKAKEVNDLSEATLVQQALVLRDNLCSEVSMPEKKKNEIGKKMFSYESKSMNEVETEFNAANGEKKDYATIYAATKHARDKNKNKWWILNFWKADYYTEKRIVKAGLAAMNMTKDELDTNGGVDRIIDIYSKLEYSDGDLEKLHEKGEIHTLDELKYVNNSQKANNIQLEEDELNFQNDIFKKVNNLKKENGIDVTKKYGLQKANVEEMDEENLFIPQE